jgi:demethylmenaquinone methyltransferase/2-methoxy-6-polyprenyl-1,4-benzoquinol methylase
VALAIARRHPDASVIGLDPSPAMLGVARRKLAEAGLTARVTLREGDAQALPFEEGSFDAVTIAFGIRNVPDRTRGLAEMARVLRPGGRLVVLELGEPRDGWLGVPVRFHIRQVVPRLGALLSGAREYRYLQRSVSAFPPPPQFAALLATAGLEAEPPRSLAFGAAHLYVAHKPGLTPEGSAPLSWRCPTAPPRNGS